jgi:signal transduction histidine kinase/CheY-like chemotaxis protein/HPt (histidine-containing phosphotransfer) domain-containing protein
MEMDDAVSGHFPDKLFRTTSVKNKFRIFSCALLVIVYLLGTVAFFLSMRQIGYVSLQDNLSLVAETMRLRLATAVNSELSLVCKMADSPLIQRYFLDPSNQQLKESAHEEFAVYRRNFKNNSIFWINDVDKLFYSDEKTPYRVDPSLPENYWYNMTLYETELYNFNINYNPDLREINLWINAPVFIQEYDGNKKPIGMLGTGINITDFISSILTIDPNISLFMFNRFGEITAATDTQLVFDKVLLAEHLGSAGGEIIAVSKSLRDSDVKIFIHNATMYGVCSIPQLGWYLVDSVPITVSTLFDPVMTGIFCSLLVLITLVVVAFNIFVSRMQNVLESQNQELVLLNRQATASSRAKSDFLARTSHEIRTPMNAILGLSELARREHGKPKALEYIMGIKSAGASLLAIINDILDFSKIESGNLPIHPAPYGTASLLNDTLTVIRVRMAETPLELISDISPDIPGNMIGDAGRIKQILLNLLSNAVKYTKKGFIRFSASGEPSAADTIRLTFTVEDSGIGIRKEDMPKLFGEFMRIDEKRNINIEGTGLGLVIARSLCRAMDGDITARSEYGKGSVFTATLVQTVTDWKPMGDMTDISTDRAETQCVTFIAPEAEVLVVDDFSSNLLVAEGLLMPYQMRVFTCLNGHEAVALVRERPFDLVLMDHMMPEMDGVEATHAIRGMSGERCRALPIIALTANAVSGMREMFLENGFNDFLSKPIETAKLDAVLKKWIPEGKRRNAPENGGISPSEGMPEMAFPEIAGVDVAAGLARIGGSKSRYLELLEMFCRDAQAGFALLEQAPPLADHWSERFLAATGFALDDFPLRPFTTLVHALKSASANIGADLLSQSAALLEKAGREADLPTIRDKLPPFREELAALMERIRESTAAARAGNSETGVEPDVGEALARLRDALEAKDIDAIDDALARLQALPLTAKTREDVSGIADFVLAAEFTQATEAVVALYERQA